MVTKKLKYLFFVVFFSLNINASIIYEKNNKIVTDIDLEIYKQLYKENYGSEINDKNALKDLILIKGVIEDLIKKNPDFINKIDKEILSQFGTKPMANENIKEFIRFSKIRDEFIINYFRNELKVEEVKNIFKNLDNLNLPISDDNCLLIKEIINLQSNTEFIENFFNNLKNDSNEFVITLNKKKYSVCLDQKTFKSIEKLIVEYIQMQTKEEFEKFVYGKTSN
tara:strand:+ start:344 stop:1015 length:672 start_codon:yes stop_codon:yes gene_type:complete